jgi:hypothetical protein
MSGQLRAPAALPPRRNPPLCPLDRSLNGFHSRPGRGSEDETSFFSPCRELNPDRSVRSPATVLTVLCLHHLLDQLLNLWLTWKKITLYEFFRDFSLTVGPTMHLLIRNFTQNTRVLKLKAPKPEWMTAERVDGSMVLWETKFRTHTK